MGGSGSLGPSPPAEGLLAVDALARAALSPVTGATDRDARLLVPSPSFGRLVQPCEVITTEPPEARGRVSPGKMRPVSPRLSSLRPGPVAIFKDADALTRRAIRRDYSLLTRAHPSEAQARGLRWVLACGSDERLHVTSVNADQTVRTLRAARARAGRGGGDDDDDDARAKAPTAGTTGLHLLLAAEDVRAGATIYKVRPPIRHRGHGKALWEALRAGVVDAVHSGYDAVDPHLKCAVRGDFARASPGTCAFANADVLPALWARLVADGSPNLGDVANWLARNPAKALGLATKGAIAVGKDADLLLFDEHAPHAPPDADDRRGCRGIYDALPKRGLVKAVFVRGQAAYLRGHRRPTPAGRPMPNPALREPPPL